MSQFWQHVITFFEKNGFAFEMLICNILFTRALPRRKNFVWRALGSFVVFLGVCMSLEFFNTRYTFWDIPKYIMLVTLATLSIVFALI